MLSTDPIDFLLDDDGDIVIPLQFSRGLPAVAQALRIRVLLFRGEWFLNLDTGVPYLENDVVEESAALLGQVFDAVKARAMFRDAILSAPNVTELRALDVIFDGATRVMTVSWKVRTVFGDLTDSLDVEA